MSLVVSVFPAPDSPLQRGHAGTSVNRTTIFQHLSTLLQTHHRPAFWAGLNKDALSLCRNPTAFSLTSAAYFVLVYQCVHLSCSTLQVWLYVVLSRVTGTVFSNYMNE